MKLRNIALLQVLIYLPTLLFRFVITHPFDGQRDRRTDRQTDVDSKTAPIHSQLHDRKLVKFLADTICRGRLQLRPRNGSSIATEN